MKPTGIKIIAMNKKAFHDYHIEESIEAGIVLTGTEVKSARQGRVNLRESYAAVDKNELWLIGAHISPYEQGNINNHDPLRNRKLLIHSAELQAPRRESPAGGLHAGSHQDVLQGWAGEGGGSAGQGQGPLRQARGAGQEGRRP